MNRMSYIEVVGKKYPLSLSLGATKEICNRYGSLENMQKNLSNTEDIYNLIDTLTSVMEILIRQGCAYIDAFGCYLPKEENLAVDENGKCKVLTQELLETVITMDNVNGYIDKVLEAMGKSSETDVEAEPLEKNVTAPQEATD